MRLSVFVCVAGMAVGFVLAANPGYSQHELEQRAHVEFKGLPLAKALEQLQRQTGVPLAYQSSALPSAPEITYSATKKVKMILADVLGKYDLTYEVKDGFVLLKPQPKQKEIEAMPVATVPQPVEITGTVQDTAGNFLTGVTVQVVGNPQLGSATDINGRFVLAAPADATLVFSYLGFQEQRITPGAQRSLTVVLQPAEESSLDEVVVVGFGQQKKISVVGSQATIKPEELKLPVRNLSNSIIGRIPGIIAVQRKGEPGYDGSDIWIRGIATLDAGLSRPLILVDGVPRSFSNIDPEDIESFTVLKDASATAVYGVRGANGVIILTTKKGSPGKPRFNVRYNEGITRFVKLPEFADGATFMEMVNEANTNMGQTPTYSQEKIQETRDGTDPYLSPNVDWFDELFRDFGRMRSMNANIDGGFDRATYYVGLGYYQEEGQYRDVETIDYDFQSKAKRFNATTNLTFKPTVTTDIQLGIQGYLMVGNSPGRGEGTIFGAAYERTPISFPARYPDGRIGDLSTSGLTSPYALLTQTGYSTYWDNNVMSNLRITQQLPFVLDGLSFTAMASFDASNYNKQNRTKASDTWHAERRNDEGELEFIQKYTGSRFLSYNKEAAGSRQLYVESALNYVKTIGDHNVTGMFLFNLSDLSNSQADNLESSLPYRSLGIAGRGTYSFRNKYLAEVNFGYNGSENFVPEKRYGFFPSVGLGWVVSDEPFFEGVKPVMNFLKFRATWGKVGNSNIGGRRFAYLNTVYESVDGYTFGKDQSYSYTGKAQNEIGVNVGWETSTKYNLGIEAWFFNSMLNIQADLFKEHREDIFLRRQGLPGYLGVRNAPYGNIGKVDNQGIEGQLTFQKVWGDVRLQMLGNFTFNRNEVVEDDRPWPYEWQYRTGRKVGQNFGRIALGYFKDEAEIANAPFHTGTVRPGDIRYKDINGDGKIDSNDEVPIGYGDIPEIVYGAGLTFGYKAFTLSALFQGISNVDILVNGEGVFPFMFSTNNGNLQSNIHDRWTVDNPNPDAFYPRLSIGELNANNATSTHWLQNGRYLRLKSLQFAYDLPKAFVAKAGLRGANIFFSGINLLTLSEFKLWDVELGNGRGSTYPNVATYSFGATLNF